MPAHQQITDVSNLKCQMIVKSLTSRGYLSNVFNWQWNYYTVTPSGVKYLIQQLGVPTDVVPATYTKKRAATQPKTVDEDEKPSAETAGMDR